MSSNGSTRNPLPPTGHGGSPIRSAAASRYSSSMYTGPSPPRPPYFRRGTPKPTSRVLDPDPIRSTRDLFRTSQQTPRGSSFAPKLSPSATRPGPNIRKFAAQKSVSSGMAATSSTQPFELKIPSPDPELTGEVLAKKVPHEPYRQGSIYADEYLSYACPQHFNELQRRQFFCILDLRRLKYSANEIFAKKDWKLNMANFAKEYEKSRGMIMLRYGLYRFKNHKVSPEVLRKWKIAHNLPLDESEDEIGASKGTSPQKARTTTPARKRKAEGESTETGNALTASTANQNKRRSMTKDFADPTLMAPQPYKNSKRKVETIDEMDENLPSRKSQRSTSGASAKFENIVNKTQSSSGSPSKRPPQDGTPFAPKASDFGTPSLTGKTSLLGTPSKRVDLGLNRSTNGGLLAGTFKSSHKAASNPATNGTNIFGYLSESSAHSSSNENGAADVEDTDSESDNGSEEQVVTQSKESSTAPTLSTSKASGLTSKGGLFGRVSMGPDGQPMRATPGAEAARDDTLKPRSAAPPNQIMTPAKRPGDYTFDPAKTPISFKAPSPVEETESTTPKPETRAGKFEREIKPAKSRLSKTSMFGASTQSNSFAQPASKMFGASEQSATQTLDATKSIFATPKPSASTSADVASNAQSKSLFGAVGQSDAPATTSNKRQATSVFGESSRDDRSPKKWGLFPGQSLGSQYGACNPLSTPIPDPPTSVFGTPSKTIDQSGITNGLKPSSSATTTQKEDFSGGKDNQPKGSDQSESTQNTPSSTADIFGKGAKPSTTGMFGPSTSSSVFGTPSGAASSSDAKPSTEVPKVQPSEATTAKTVNVFGKDAKPSATGTAPAQAVNVFGKNATPSTTDTTPAQAVNVFGKDAKPSATSTTPAQAVNVFGQDAKPSATSVFNTSTSSPLFGGSPAAGSATVKPLFGGPKEQSSADGTTVKSSVPGASPAVAAELGNQKTPAPKEGFFGASPVSALPGFGLFGSKPAGADEQRPVRKEGLFGASPVEQNVGIFGASKATKIGEDKTSSVAEGQTPSAAGIFGEAGKGGLSNAGSSTPSVFGAAGNSSIFKTEASSIPAPNNQASTGLFNLGGTSSTAAPDNQASSGPSFSFGAAPSTPAPNNPASSGPSFSFGAAGSSTPSVSFGASTAPAGQQDAAPAGANTSSFNFGQSSSGGSGFTFTADSGNGQSFNNPFASASQNVSSSFTFGSTAPDTASSDTKPATPVSTSFTFGAGSQAPSTPNNAQGSNIFAGLANGASAGPSFNFTQATPPQNASSIFASQPASAAPALLNAGTGAASPNFAPSSMGTTPEPQSQNEDGEEPQEQLSLTNGGPGEEDETLLHEVRAKAIKFEPPGEDDKEKSPWRTQGVGPLRVLKNKATGSVRILLRAEPRGHVAMNKIILPEVAYTVSAKTVRFPVAKDEGSGLETWLLQLKTAAFAEELGEVLKEHSAANKK